MLTMRLTSWETACWRAMAQAAYANGHNATGHRFSAAGALPDNSDIPLPRYDSLMRDYRAWLTFNEYPEASA